MVSDYYGVGRGKEIDSLDTVEFIKSSILRREWLVHTAVFSKNVLHR